MLPFSQWKDTQVAKDSLANNVFKFYRPRDWYYKAYGGYCNKFRLESAVKN